MQDDCDLALGMPDDDDVGEDIFDEPDLDGGGGATGRWTREEHHLFVKGLEMYGKGWKKIASLIKTRTVVQIRTVRHNPLSSPPFPLFLSFLAILFPTPPPPTPSSPGSTHKNIS